MTQTNIYRASPIKARRTQSQIQQLDIQILDILREDRPQSIRHIFYRLTDPRLPEPVAKTELGYRQVQDRCVKLRRNGTIPYSWISDSSRAGYHTHVFNDSADFIRSVKSLYRADLWRDAEFQCEVWTESRSIASVIRDDCEELAVSLYPCGGFTSLSFAHSAAQEHNRSGIKKPLVVFYIGDYDPAGVLIDISLEKELRSHLKKDIDLDFKRIAINQEMIDKYDLPTKPRKTGDKRALHIGYSVEAEALPAKTMRKILREEIEALLPQHALMVSQVAEECERNHLESLASLLEKGEI